MPPLKSVELCRCSGVSGASGAGDAAEKALMIGESDVFPTACAWYAGRYARLAARPAGGTPSCAAHTYNTKAILLRLETRVWMLLLNVRWKQELEYWQMSPWRRCRSGSAQQGLRSAVAQCAAAWGCLAAARPHLLRQYQMVEPASLNLLADWKR